MGSGCGVQMGHALAALTQGPPARSPGTHSRLQQNMMRMNTALCARHHPSASMACHCQGQLLEEVQLLSTLQVRRLRPALIVVEGLGLGLRCCGSSIFAFKYYSATSQYSVGICVRAQKGEGSREGTRPCPLCCLKLTHWTCKPAELISYTNGMQAGKG